MICEYANSTWSALERAYYVWWLGELRQPYDRPKLIAALKDPAANVRRRAASALGKHKAWAAVQPLQELLKTETYPQVRQYAAVALGRIGNPDAMPTLVELQEDPAEKDYVRQAAGEAVQRIYERWAPILLGR